MSTENKATYMTQEGLDKLKAKLRRMVSVERPEISKQIAEARDKGDLSENAEYDAARLRMCVLLMSLESIRVRYK